MCLMTAPSRREVAAQHRDAPFGPDRLLARRDHLVVADERAVDVLAERPAVDGQAVGVQADRAAD